MPQGQGNNRSGLKLRSLDGTSVTISGDSLTEYVLHPVFLRFLALVLLVFALLDQRPELRDLGGWALTMLWSVIGCVVLSWFMLASPVVARMTRSGWIGQVYTPVLLVPMVLFAEIVLQAASLLLGGHTGMALPHILQYAARDMIVVGLFDLFHSRFVILAHPLVMPPAAAQVDSAPQAVLPLALPEPEAEPDARAEDTVPDGLPEGVMVRIGPVVLPLASILMIRTEDHYLGVTTRSGKALHRAKMADIAELHSGLAGMQINRSVWIAYAAVKQLIDAENRQVVVTLITGDEERVAKPRIFAFRQAYSKFLASQSANG